MININIKARIVPFTLSILETEDVLPGTSCQYGVSWSPSSHEDHVGRTRKHG